MNRLSANISLYIITFFSAIQYVFLANVPDTVSTFAFLSITNLIGFLIMLCAFFGELRRLDKKQVHQSAALSLELLGFNVFLLLGSRGTEASVVACVLSSYFAFIILISFLVFHQRPEKCKVAGVTVMLAGVYMMMDANLSELLQIRILYLIIADVFFALYLLSAEKYATSSNPALLAMGQAFFNFLITTVIWAVQSMIQHTPISLPDEPAFWGSVFFISFFIRGLYGIVQIYAQRYVSPLNVSLIFSTEIVMTLALSPVLSAVLGTKQEAFTVLKVAGAFVMIFGLLVTEEKVYHAIAGRFAHDAG